MLKMGYQQQFLSTMSAPTFHALIHRFIISVCSAFWPLGRLDK